MEYGKFKLTDEANKQLQQQGEAAAARGARANAAIETKKGNTAEAARWTAKADETEQKITKNRGYTITGNEAIDVRNELRIRAGLAPSTDITPQWKTIHDTNKAYTNYLDDLDKQEKQLQYQITKLKRKEQTAAEDTGDPDVVYDATHNDTIRTLSNQLDRIRAQKSFASENQTVFNVSVKGDSKLFDEYRDLYYQEQGNRLASWASAFAGSDGSINAARNAQTQQRLNELRVELKKKGYTDEDIQAYINVANTKENQEYVQAAQEWANKNILTQNLATAGSILTAPIRGAMGAIGIALDPGTKNSPYSYLSNVAHGVQETVGEDIKNDIVRSVKRFLPDGKTADKAADYIGTAGSWVYQAAVSSLESALNMGLGGHLGEVLMGLDAATSTYNEALNNGLSADKALGSALAAGAFETIFEHMSMENLRGFKSAAASSNIFKSMASLMFTEGSEEFFTDIANEIYDYMANGGLSAYERFKEEYLKANPNAKEKAAQKAYAIQFGKQLGQSFIVGALSGGMHGSVMSAGMGVQNKINNVTGNLQMGAQVRSTAANQGVSAAEVAKGLTEQVQEGGKAAKALGKLSTETETKQNALQKLGSVATTMRTGKAVNAALKEISDTQRSVVIEALQEDGKLSKTAATELLDSYNRIQNMTATEDDVVRVTDNSELMESTLEELEGNAEYNTRQSTVEEFRNTLLNNIVKTNTERALKAGKKVFGEKKIKDAKKAAERSDAVKEAIKTGTTEELKVPTYAATATDVGNVQLGAIKSVEDGKVQVIADESGATVDLNDVIFSDTTDGENAATIYNTLRDMMTGAGEYRTVMSVEGANAALAMLQGSTLDAGTFLRQFYDAYQAGTVGRNIETFMFDTDYDLSNEELAAAYTAGAKEYNVKPGITRIGTKELTGRQKKEVEVLEPMLEKLGVKLILVDSLVSKSGEVWGEAYGSTEGDVIVLALESIGRENLISVTGYHELFHWMGKIDPQGQKALIKSVIETLKKTDGVDYKAIYDQKAKVYKNANEAKIEEEIACQYLGTILASNQARIAAAKGNTGLWQKALAHLKEWFSNIKQEIKTKFASDMAVQAALMQDAETAEKQVDAFLEMLEGIESKTSSEFGVRSSEADNSFAGVPFRDSQQVKSADPVTYDDEGNVIPLSERFNPEENDIRYSLVEDAKAEAKMAELRGQNEQLQEELQNLNAMFDAYKRVTRQREGKVPSKQKMMDILKKYMLNDPKSKDHRTEMAENIISLLNRVMDGSITFNSFSFTVWDMMVDEVQHAGHWENIGDNSAFKKEFRDDGKMAQVYLDQAEYDKVAKQYGGRSQFRKAMFGKLNVTTDKNAGAKTLQDFYEGLVKKGYGLEATDAPLTMIENMMAKYKEETRLWTDDDVPGNLGKSAGEIAEDMSMQLLTDILSNANVLNGIDTELYTERIAELQAEVQNARQRRIEKALDNARKEARQQTAQLEADETLTSSEIDEKSREIELRLIRENLARDYQERMRAYEKQSRRAYQTEQERKDIRRRVRKISEMLIKNTKTKNVPQPMKKYVKEIIMDHMNDDGIFSKKEMETLQIDLARLKTPDVNGPTFDFTRFSEALRDQYLEMKNDMTGGGQMYGVGMRLADMTPTQVDIMNAFTENVLHVVEHAGETFLEHRNGNIMQDGESVIKNLRKVFEGMSEKEKKRTRGLINSMMKNDYMTSFYFFKEHMGGMIGDYFDMITLAESNEGIRLREIEKFFSDLKEKYDYDKNKWGKESHLLHLPTYESRIDENGELPVVSIKNWDVDLSTEACMQVYAWYRREVMSGQQSSHLVPYINKDGDVFGGGVVLNNDLQKAQSKLSQAADDFKAGFKASKDRSKGTEEYIAFLKEKENEINVAADKNRHLLTEGAVEAIIESLTEEQKKYVEEVTDFLSHTCGEWGNDATMKWYGVRFFEEDYYFPYETPSEFSSRRYGLTNEKRLGNWGPTNRPNVYAHTPLVLSSFTETASRHAYEMATYSEFLVPIEQMTSLLSYSNLEGEDASVQSMVESVYGDRALSYISNFMTQLNGGVKGDEVDSLVNRLTGKFKAGSVMANFSVVIQQPSASLRAMAMIDPKYFFKRNGLRKADYEEMVRHSGVAVIKEIGGFDTDIGSNIAKTLSGTKTKMDKVNDFMGWGAEKADTLTWTWIWNACKYEVADIGKEYVYDKNNQRHRWIAQTFIDESIKESTAEFDEKIKQELFLDDVRARFEDVVHRTQVYDSVISKNRWMRSETGLLKMLTAFMAEPTMSLNMLMMSGKGKTIAKKTAIAAFVGNIIVNSALRSIVSMWRHRDEDETYFESWVEEFVKDLIGDRHVLFLDGAWSPFGMIPLIKDIISLLQGYDVERSDISVAGDVVEDVKDILNSIKGNDKDITTWGVPDMELMMNLGFDVGKMFGVPAGNVYRDGSSIARWFDYLINDPKWGYSLSAFKEAIKRGLSLDQSDMYRAFMAVLKDDEGLIERMTAADKESVDKLMANGFDEDEAIEQAEINARDNFDTKCADGLVRYDPEKRAQEAAECLNSGTLEGMRRHDELRQEMIDDGFSNNAVQRAIDQCYKSLQPAEDKDVKEKKQLDAYSYDILDNAMDANDKAAYQHVREKLMEQGKSEDTINDHVTKRITELFRDNEITMDTAITMYQEYAGKTKAKAEDKAKDIITDMLKDGILTADKAKDMYTKYAGLDADKAAANADYNKYIMDHPNTNMDSTKWGAYTKIISGVGKSAKDCGIDAEVFATYKDKAAECHADVDKNGETISGSKRAKVLKVIDELPITKEQKDALYYLNDYAPSTLRDTPWHK